MMFTPKSLKQAVMVQDKNGKDIVGEAAGLVLDCGDGAEQVVTALVIQQPQEFAVDVLDADGNPTGETTTETRMVDAVVPIASLMDDAAALSEGMSRYVRDYMAGKAIEAVQAPVALEPSKEVSAMFGVAVDATATPIDIVPRPEPITLAPEV